MKEGEWKVFAQDIHTPVVSHNLHLVIRLDRNPTVGMRFKFSDESKVRIVRGNLPDDLDSVVVTGVSSHSWTHGHTLTISALD